MDAAIVDRVDVPVGLLLEPRVLRPLPAALVAPVFEHARQAPAASAENLD